MLLFVMGLVVGGLGSYYINNYKITTLNDQVSQLQNQVSLLAENQTVTVTNQTVTIYQNGTAIVDIYKNVSQSIVLILGIEEGATVQGSGFIVKYEGQMVVLTNYHVVVDTTSLSVTFSNGNGYSASVLGTDAYADLAVLSVDAPSEELKPLTLVSSSGLQVGDSVIAIGNPYGLVGSLTTGVVSALGRSEQADFTSSFSIANMIQTSTPINPGNSGGPLLNALGNVVGITNSMISNSQGVGFAIPSDTILRELPSLIATGSYTDHSFLGINVVDMDYHIAKEAGVNVTYGVLVERVNSGGAAEKAGIIAGTTQVTIGAKTLLIGGDIITRLNDTKIRNNDDLASYLEQYTVPGDVLIVTLLRDNDFMTTTLTLATRPAPSV
jgi:S1-C subfamily serine protease